MRTNPHIFIILSFHNSDIDLFVMPTNLERENGESEELTINFSSFHLLHRNDHYLFHPIIIFSKV